MLKKFRSRICLILLFILMVLLVGCVGDSNTGNGRSDTENASSNTEQNSSSERWKRNVFRLMKYFPDSSKRVKWGYVNRDGEVLVDFKYDDVNWFFDEFHNVGVVMKNYLYGLVDGNGNEIIPCNYSKLSWYKEYELLAAQYEERGKWGYITKDEQVVVPFEYDECSWSEYNTPMMMKKDEYGNENWYLLDYKAGDISSAMMYTKQEYEEKFDKAPSSYDFYNQKDSVLFPKNAEDDGSKYYSNDSSLTNSIGIADSNGNFVIAPQFGYVGVVRTENGNFIVGKYDEERKLKMGVIDAEGNEILPMEYLKVEDVTNPNKREGEDYYFIASEDHDGRYALINESGERLTDFLYDSGGPCFNHGLLSVGKERDNKNGYKVSFWGYIDEGGREAIECKYDVALGFHPSDALALVYAELPGNDYLSSAYIDTNGKVAICLSEERGLWEDFTK